MPLQMTSSRNAFLFSPRGLAGKPLAEFLPRNCQTLYSHIRQISIGNPLLIPHNYIDIRRTENCTLGKIGVSGPLSRPDGLFIPEHNAALLKDLHAYDEGFALETVGGHGWHRLFIRFPHGNSRVRSRLLVEFGAVSQSNNDDWLRIGRTDYAAVRTVTLSRDSVLSIARDSPDHIRERWRNVLRHMIGRANDGSDATLGVRVLLKPARPGWEARFKSNAPSGDEDAQALGDARRWAAKASGPAFQAEFQLVAICKDVREQRRRSATALDELAKLMVELAGGEKVWRLRIRKQSVGQNLARARNNRMRRTFDPWPPLDFLSAERQLRHVLSPEEAAPLWLAQTSRPAPVAVDTVLSDQFEARTETRPAQIDRLPTLEELIAKLRAMAPGEMDEATGSSAPGVEPAISAQPHRDVGAEGRGVVHSSRPPGLPVRRMPDRKTMRRGSGSTLRRDSSLIRDGSEDSRSRRIRDLGLSAVDIEIFDRLGDLPWASRQDLAYATGRGIATVYKSIDRFRELQLVESGRVYINGKDEERFWIREDQWDRVMGDLRQCHTQNMVQRLWLNPEGFAAVYRLTGILTQDKFGRELRELRWLWRRPFDAVAQYSDGWGPLCGWASGRTRSGSIVGSRNAGTNWAAGAGAGNAVGPDASSSWFPTLGCASGFGGPLSAGIGSNPAPR